VGAFDLERFLGLLADAGLEPTHQTYKSYVFGCPECARKKRLYVRKADGRFVCWFCRGGGMEGAPEFLLARVAHVSVAEAKARMYGEEGAALERLLDLEWIDSEDPAEAHVVAPTISWPWHAAELDHPHAARGVAYLESRGVPLDVAQRYGIRYSPPERRVYFPVEDRGRLVGWQARLVIPNVFITAAGERKEIPKILSSRNIPRDRVLMFGDRITGDHAFLAEGPFDAVKADLVGGNAAAMGKCVTRGQVRILRARGVRRVTLALDPDAAAETSALIQDLVADMEVRVFEPDRGTKDPGDMSFEAVAAGNARARRVFGWELLLHFG
jgi:DNA primase